MDPLSALSVAAAVVQFIQFSDSIISDTIEIYQSLDGAKQSNRTVESLTTRLSELTTTLVTAEQQSQTRRPTPIADAYGGQLRVIVGRCQSISDELRKILDALKGSERRDLGGSFLSSVKAIRKDRKIKYLEVELRWAHNELSGCLIAMIQYVLFTLMEA
jgi:hypothetical protein